MPTTHLHACTENRWQGIANKLQISHNHRWLQAPFGLIKRYDRHAAISLRQAFRIYLSRHCVDRIKLATSWVKSVKPVAILWNWVFFTWWKALLTFSHKLKSFCCHFKTTVYQKVARKLNTINQAQSIGFSFQEIT